MPELPGSTCSIASAFDVDMFPVSEVERATALLRQHAVGKTIHHVDTFEDKLVFSGFTHEDFVSHQPVFLRCPKLIHFATGPRDHWPSGRKCCSLW